MIVSIIAAVADNGVIGNNNQLVWRLPADFRYFKNTTTGHFVIMGRKTFESMGGKPLKDRTNIIVTHNRDYQPEGCIVLHNLKDALKYCEENGEKEAFILGGADIYRQSMELTDKLYITEVHGQFQGDTFFPKISENTWKEVRREDHLPDEKNPHPYSFVVYERS